MCNLTGKSLQDNVLGYIEDIILNIKDHYERFAVVPRGKSKLQVDVDKKQCWVSKDYNCPLKEQCNGLFKPECKEHISNEEACHAIDKMIEWYYQVEEPEFLKFYNCHLEMLE